MSDNNTGWPNANYTIHDNLGVTFKVTVNGRDRWALDQLIIAGSIGCTPIQNPAPRWSAYVFNLRGHGIPIETVTEAHGGAFSGTHARYVLKAKVMA